MHASRRRLLLKVWKLFDLWIMSSMFVLAAVPGLHGGGGISLADFLSMRIKVENFFLFVGLLVVWHLVFVSLGVYQSQRLVSRQEELARVFGATSAGALCLGLLSLLCRIRMVTPSYLLVFWLLTMATVMASRLALRFILEGLRRRGRNTRYVLIVGTNSRAIEFAQRIESKAVSGYKVIGFVDEPWSGLAKFQM